MRPTASALVAVAVEWKQVSYVQATVICSFGAALSKKLSNESAGVTVLCLLDLILDDGTNETLWPFSTLCGSLILILLAHFFSS